MKREKKKKEQRILNVYEIQCKDNKYYVDHFKGKTLQSILNESKFKTLATIKLENKQLEKETAEALIETGNCYCTSVLVSCNRNKVVVFKHLINEGYRFRSMISERDLIGFKDSHNIESCLLILNYNDYLPLYDDLKFKPNENNMEIDLNNENKETTISTVDKPNDIQYIAVVQKDTFVFISVKKADWY